MRHENKISPTVRTGAIYEINTRTFFTPLHVKSYPRAKFLRSTATLKAQKPSSLEWRRPGSSSDGIVVKKEEKGGRTVAERMQLFRRAFTSRICDRHLLYPPLYIPGTVLHPSYPPATSFSPRTTITSTPTNRPLSHGGTGCRRGTPTHRAPTVLDP